VLQPSEGSAWTQAVVSFLSASTVSHSHRILVETLPADGLLTPCTGLEELYLGYGFIEIPGAFICRVLGSVTPCALVRLTVELPERIREREDKWKDFDEPSVRMRERQETGSHLVVEISTSLPVEIVQVSLPRSRDQGPLLVGSRNRSSLW
jgi:hypothetical protein